MIPLTPDEVLPVLDARISRDGSGGQTLPPLGVAIDSRTIQDGECFIAIQGPRFDGHDFIADALEKGARWIIHRRGWSPAGVGQKGARALFLEVQSTDLALQQLGAYVRRKWGGRLVAITGSMGKTTTRVFSASLLSSKYRVLESRGNLNNEFGVPLSLLRLKPEHELAVLELGMNRAGEIGRLAALCRPDVAVITNVAPVHLEFFEDLQGIAAAKGEILDHLAPEGVFVFNADDPLVCKLAARAPGRTVSFGTSGTADIRVSELHVESLHSMRFTLALESRPAAVEVAFSGRHFLYNLAAAATVASVCQLSPSQIEAGLQQLRVGQMRGQVLKVPVPGEPDVTIWDDSYNSNPEAVRSVLETTASVRGYRRKILVLGEMRELGAESAELHRQIGLDVAATSPDLLVAVGAEARPLVEGAREGGMGPHQIRYYENSDQAGEALAEEVSGGDLVVCKGSRGVRIERVVQRLIHQTGACGA